MKLPRFNHTFPIVLMERITNANNKCKKKNTVHSPHRIRLEEINFLSVSSKKKKVCNWQMNG